MTQNEENKRQVARASFTGSRLTEAQFDGAWNLAGILHREIHKSGSFVEPLTDYAHAYARNERFDAARGEIILRDIFKARFDQSLNQLREGLAAKEGKLREAPSEEALRHARSVGAMSREEPTTPFYQAFDRAAVTMARESGITEAAAKSMMKEAFKEAEGHELYEAYKALEAQHHQPDQDSATPTRQRSGPKR